MSITEIRKVNRLSEHPTRYIFKKLTVLLQFTLNTSGGLSNQKCCAQLQFSKKKKPFLIKFFFFFQIVNWSDPSWWQARKVNSKERPGLVPSQDLEERRKCFVKHNGFKKQVVCCGAAVRLVCVPTFLFQCQYKRKSLFDEKKRVQFCNFTFLFNFANKNHELHI